MNTDGIPEFLAVAKTGTFTSAAHTLGVSIAHVSRRISALENRIGVILFARSTRSVKLTPRGEEFFERCDPLWDDLEEALQSVSESNIRLEGRLRIAALSGSFANKVVAPAIAAFAAQHPGVDIEIDFSARHVDLKREGFDFAIRSGQLEDSDLIARQLATRTSIAAASRSYLEEHGQPQNPADLSKHTCILSGLSPWRFNIDGKIRSFKVRGRLKCNSGEAITAACEQGVGISYIASAGYGHALMDRRLVPILRPYWNNEASLYLVYPNRKFIPHRVQFAMQHIEDVARIVQTEEQQKILAI